jgi:multicomponent Na+:H+ antiporter subunit D
VATLPPLAVAIPLLVAALVTAFAHFLPVRADDLAGIATAAATTALCAILLVRSTGGLQIHWFGGWKPRNGVALGIDFAVDTFGAGLATLAAALVTAALVYSWRYFDEVGTLFHVLMLVFLAAMVGFAFTGDLFNLFVFFEVMGVAAYALAGYRIEDAGPIQGALNFAITNTVGAFLILIGLALVYGRTGALNLAQIGRTLAAREPDGLVIVAFTLLLAGFLVKAAAVPFHFWLADAHAVAPAPVCVLFSGVMVELGLFAAARVYWTAFEGTLGGHEEGLRAVLVGLGCLTALVGAVMCFLQRHLKRLLAYSTISHTGVFLVGFGLLTPGGLAGVAVFVVAHGLLKGALFLAAGTLLQRVGAVDELLLHGKGRGLPVAAAAFFLGGLALAAPPFTGAFLGHALVEEAGSAVGYGWIAVVLTVSGIVAGAAILRAGARVFLGWGPRRDPLLTPEPAEEPEAGRETPRTLLALPTAVLLAAGLAVSLAPGLKGAAELGAERFQDRRGYAAAVLDGNVHEYHAPVAVTVPRPTASSVAWSLASVAGAVGLAALALGRPRLSARLRRTPGLEALRTAHSGLVGDYVTWLTVGTAVLGGLLALTFR